MRKVWLVYDNTVGLPDELRIFTGEKAAMEYKRRMQKAGIKASDIVICDEPVERTGKVEVYRTLQEEEPKKKAQIVITHKVPGPKPKPRPEPEPSPVPPIPPEDPDDDEEDEEERIHQNREEMNEKANNLPLSIKNRRVIDVLGKENEDLFDWASLDADIHQNKSNYRVMSIMNDLRMTEPALQVRQ